VTATPTGWPRREYFGTLTVAGLAAGLILLASSQRWLTLHVQRPAPFAPVAVSVSGRNEFSALFGLAVVALVTVVLVAVSGGWGRQLLGLLLVVVGLSVIWYGVRGLSGPGPVRTTELLGSRAPGTAGVIRTDIHPQWPLVTILAGTILTVAAVLIAARGRRWAGGLPRRYDAPADAAGSEDPWRRMDRGDDPTISDR
jgi:uncharacterized membrane protein (TIGR02234 family)